MKVFHNAGVEVDTAVDNTTTTYAIGLPPFGDEHCVVSDPKNPQPIVYGADGSDDDITTNIYSETYERTAQTVWHVQTGGKALTSVWLPQSVFQISGAAWEVASKRATPALPHDRTIPPQNIQINGKALGSDNIMYQKLPDNADIDVTPYVAGKDFYTFYVGASKHTLTSYTLHPALTDTNRTRLQVGVGEEVSVYLDPPLTMTFPESPAWYVSGGGIDATTGSTTTFTAASNACFAKVTVNVRDVWLNKNFTVLEPSGIDTVHTYKVSEYTNDFFHVGNSGAGMTIVVYVAPTDVSFYRVTMEEVGEDATNVWGYYTNNPPYDPYGNISHKGSTTPSNANGHGKGDDPFQVFSDNSWQHGAGILSWDNCAMGNFSPNPPDYPLWSSGGFTWNIPGAWKIGNGAWKTNMTPWNQTFTMQADGTVTIEKFGLSVTRSPSSP